MPDIHHEIKIGASPQTVFEALTTNSGVSAWHTPTVEGSGEVGTEWVLRFAGRPEFRWEIITSEAPGQVVWRCTAGPGDSVGTTAAFTMSPGDDGRTLVEHVHAGWPGTHGNYRKCNTLWGVLLHHLRMHVETGDAAPAFE